MPIACDGDQHAIAGGMIEHGRAAARLLGVELIAERGGHLEERDVRLEGLKLVNVLQCVLLSLGRITSHVETQAEQLTS